MPRRRRKRKLDHHLRRLFDDNNRLMVRMVAEYLGKDRMATTMRCARYIRLLMAPIATRIARLPALDACLIEVPFDDALNQAMAAQAQQVVTVTRGQWTASTADRRLRLDGWVPVGDDRPDIRISVEIDLDIHLLAARHVHGQERVVLVEQIPTDPTWGAIRNHSVEIADVDPLPVAMILWHLDPSVRAPDEGAEPGAPAPDG